VGWVGLITVGSTELAPISVPFPNLISYPWFTEIESQYIYCVLICAQI
jgi:hypothetical protein